MRTRYASKAAVAMPAALVTWVLALALTTEPASERAAAQSDRASVASGKADAATKMGPRLDVKYPAMPLGGRVVRPREVVTAAYRFAAEHPEVLAYVPCYCGCENLGHSNNTDCFVHSRAENGDVLEWEPHGAVCDVCVDVAHRAQELYGEGKPLADIRSVIEREFGSLSPRRTPTPSPVAHNH